MARITVTTNGSGDLAAHKAGCQDLNKTANRGGSRWTIDASTYREVAEDAYQDMIAEGSMEAETATNYIHFVGCTNGLLT